MYGHNKRLTWTWEYDRRCAKGKEATSNCDWVENWMLHTLQIRSKGDVWFGVIHGRNISKTDAQLLGDAFCRMRACDARTLQSGWDAVVTIYSWPPTFVISTAFDDDARVTDDSKGHDKNFRQIIYIYTGECESQFMLSINAHTWISLILTTVVRHWTSIVGWAEVSTMVYY